MMYIGLTMSCASDFWRMALIGVMVGWIGEVELAVFTTTYRETWLVGCFCGSYASAMKTNLAINIGRGDVEASKQTVRLSLWLITSVNVIVAAIFTIYAREVAHIFSTDQRYIDTSVEVRPGAALVLIGVMQALSLEQILVTFGRTKIVFRLGVLASWLVQVPSVYVLLVYFDADLLTIYFGVAAGYVVLAIFFTVYLLRVDWEAIIQESKKKS